MDYQYEEENDEQMPVIEEAIHDQLPGGNAFVQRAMSDREWIDETEIRYRKANKNLFFVTLCNIVLVIFIIGLSVGISQKNPQTNESLSKANIKNDNGTPNNPPTIVLPPTPIEQELIRPQARTPPPSLQSTPPLNPPFPEVEPKPDSIDYIDAFTAILPKASRPLKRGKISTTFGPAHKVECDCYEFHRGIDFHDSIGAPILALYDGIVARIIEVGKKGVVLEHTFDKQVTFHPDRPSTTTWYSLYFHAGNWTVSEGTAVNGGETLGLLTDAHLHQEVRIGTPCDLEDYITDPDDTCNDFGFDPHIHPIVLYPEEIFYNDRYQKIEIALVTNFDKGQDAIIGVSASALVPSVNRYTVSIVETHGSALSERKAHILDCNLRVGFDATSLWKLNERDISVPYLDPIPFDDEELRWQVNIVVPSTWIGSFKQGEEILIMVEDVWGARKDFAFGANVVIIVV